MIWSSLRYGFANTLPVIGIALLPALIALAKAAP